jgi:hypothetical protein
MSDEQNTSGGQLLGKVTLEIKAWENGPELTVSASDLSSNVMFQCLALGVAEMRDTLRDLVRQIAEKDGDTADDAEVDEICDRWCKAAEWQRRMNMDTMQGKQTMIIRHGHSQ